jgi:cytochrome c peroxidase
MALVQDGAFKKWVQKYAQNEDMFFDHFSKAFCTLLELGVPEENFKKFEPVSEGGRHYTLKTTAEQEN